MSESVAPRPARVQLRDAGERLAAAIERLKSAAESSLARCREAETGAAGIPSMLAREAELTARVAELELQARSLADVAEQVELRLDAAIAEVRSGLRN